MERYQFLNRALKYYVHFAMVFKNELTALKIKISYIVCGTCILYMNLFFNCWKIAKHEACLGLKRIYHECKDGIKKIRPEDHPLASRGLSCDD